MKKYFVVIQISLFILYVVLTQISAFASDLIAPIHNLFATFLILYFVKRTDEFRVSWMILTLMPLSWAIADGLGFVFEHLLGLDPNQYLFFSLLYILANIFMLIALSTFFFKVIKRWHKVKLALDMFVMIMIVMGIASGVFFSKINYSEVEIVELLGMLLYMLLDVFALFILMIMGTSVTVKKLPLYLRLLTLGIVVFIGADFFYSYEVYRGVYSANSFSDIIYYAGFLIIAFTSLIKTGRWEDAKGKATDIVHENLQESKLVLWLSIVPIILVIIGAINITHFAMIILSVVAYQFANTYLQKNYMMEQLLKERNRVNDELEAMVEDRTRSLEVSNQELKQYSMIDGLTNLYNRQYFMQLISERLATDNVEFSVLYMDLDRFKVINDVHGHPMGDKVLQIVADRFLTAKCSSCEFGRIGGDEFGLLFQSVKPEDLEMVSQRLMKLLEEPITIDEYQFYVGISIGIARYPMDASTIDQLMQYADIAMYHAKSEEQNNQYVLYSTHLVEKIERRNHIELLLREAKLETDFELYFQPKFNLKTKRLYGMEALIRWNHKEEGFISPGEFIPIAEETGLILRLSDWVFETAMKQVKQWNEKYDLHLIVSMNVSPLSLDSYEFIPSIIRLININEVKPEWLELEITEHSAMNTATRMEEIFTTLSNTGIAISIDDFGTGYSSLSYIKRFDVDVLKIAKELIDNITVDADEQMIVKAITMMATGLGLQTVAEGVETEEQLRLIEELGCDAVQGYRTGRPVSASDFESMHLN